MAEPTPTRDQPPQPEGALRSPAKTAQRGRVDVPALLATSLTIICWASNFPVIRFAVRELEPEHIAALRFLLASLLLGGYALLSRMALPAWRDVPAFLFFGFTGLAVSTLVLTNL